MTSCVIVDLWGGQRALVLEYSQNPDDSTLLYDVSSRLGLSSNLLKVVQRHEVSGINRELFVRIQPRSSGLCGGKQGGFGQSLRREGEAMGHSTDFGSCRTLDGRRVAQVMQEKKLVQWAIKKAERDAAQQRETESRRQRYAEEAKARADDLIASVQRDVVSSMADAVADGLRARRASAKSTDSTVDSSIGSSTDDSNDHTSSVNSESVTKQPAKKRMRNAMEAWDDEAFSWNDDDGCDAGASSQSSATVPEDSTVKHDLEESKKGEELEEEEESEETMRLRQEAIENGGIKKHKHRLYLTKSPYGEERIWICDVCGKRGRRAAVYHCKRCDYDLCVACHDTKP